MVSAVSAFDTLSVSEIKFSSNDADVSGEAFLLNGVENGASDEALFSINDNKDRFDENLGNGKKIKQGGKISSELKEYKLSYPIINDNIPLFNAEIVGQKQYWGSFYDYDSWCSNLAGNREWFWKKPSGSFKVYCVAFNDVGKLGRISSSINTLFKDEVKVTLDDGSQETISISESQKTARTSNVFMRFNFMGGSTSQAPDLGNDYGVVYASSNNKWFTASKPKIDAYKAVIESSSDLEKIINQCLNGGFWGGGLGGKGEIEACINDFNILSDIKETKIVQYDSEIIQSGLNGNIVLSNTPIYQYPVFTLKIKADWIGIFQPVGKPVFASDVTNDCFVEGNSGKIEFSIKNDANVDASFDVGITCGSGFSAINEGFIPFKAGETKKLTYYITGETESKTEGTCSVVVTDSSNPSVKVSKSGNVCTLDANQCSPLGAVRCNGNLIQECAEESGVQVWTNINECSVACEESAGVVECRDENIVVPKTTGGICEPTLGLGSLVIIPSFETKQANFLQKLIGKDVVSCLNGWTAFAWGLAILTFIFGILLFNELFKKKLKIKNKYARGTIATILAIMAYVFVLNYIFYAIWATILLSFFAVGLLILYFILVRR